MEPAGFSEVNLVDELPPALVCSICQSCPFNPKQCRKGHLFCEGCITKWLCVEQTCPLDRAPLSLADLSDNLLARNLISKLRARCPNHALAPLRDLENGLDFKRAKVDSSVVTECDWIGPLEELETHRKVCLSEVISCGHVGCGVRLQRVSWQDHSELCRFAIRACGQCGAQVERFRFEAHLADQCPHRLVPCKCCAWQGSFSRLDDHNQSCPGVRVSCDICGMEMLRSDWEKHVMNSLASHLPLLLQKVGSLTRSVALLQAEYAVLHDEHRAALNQVTSLKSRLKLLTKPVTTELAPEMTPHGEYRVFTFHVPDADRTHYGEYIGFSASNCVECGRSSMQIGFVAERVRPHEAQEDQLGRWVGVEFEKGHVPAVKGSLFIRFQVYRSADAERGVSFAHNYNTDGVALEFDSDKGAKVGDKWGFIWGRSILLTDMMYANALGPFGSLFVRYYIRFVAAQDQ